MTISVLDAVLVDLKAEGEVLDGAVANLDESGWRAPTPAAGWDVATTIAHLAWTDELALAAGTDDPAWDAFLQMAMAGVADVVDAAAFAGAKETSERILSRWRHARAALAPMLRAVPAGHNLSWFGPPMRPASMATARLMETWAHALDVYDALGKRRPAPTDRIRHIAHLGVRTCRYSFTNNGREAPVEEFRVELVAPSGRVWTYGPADAGQGVTGSAYDFCLLVTQRAHRVDLDLVAIGEDADAWLDIAQAFAGPAGTGRVGQGGPA